MMLAKTPAQKEDAQEQAAVAKRLFEAYTKQVARLALSPSGGSAATFAQLEHAAVKPSAQASYSSSAGASPSYESSPASVAAVRPRPSEPSGMLTPAEVQAKVKNAVTAANAAATAKFATEVQALDTQWQAKMQAAVTAAVQAEKKKAEEVLAAQKESAEKKLAVEASARKLAENKANLEIEKLKLEELGRASAATALTAGLQAKAEAKTINAQANILAAESKDDAAESAVNVSQAPLTGAAASAQNGSSVSPSTSPGYSSSSTAAAATTTTNSKAQLSEGVSLDDLTSAVKKLSEAQVASKMAAAAHRDNEQAVAKPDLLATYNAAKEELEASASNEKTVKLDAKETFRITFSTSEGKVKTQHNRALALSGKMKEEADKAVTMSQRAVQAASARTREAFVKNAQKTVTTKPAAASATPEGKAQVGQQPRSAAAKKVAAVTAVAKAKAGVEAAKMKAAAADTMAYNLQNNSLKARENTYKKSQRDLLRQQVSERASKSTAKEKTEATVAATQPIVSS